MKKKFFIKKLECIQIGSKYLLQIDNFIDIGINQGTPLLWKKYKNKKIICIDPLDYSEKIVKKKLKKRNYLFYKYAVGAKEEIKILNVEKNIGRSTLLKVTKKTLWANLSQK